MSMASFPDVEENTRPGTPRHPAAEGGGSSGAPPPDDDLRTLVQQLLGGHTQLRARVDTISNDVATLLRESRLQRRDVVESQRVVQESHGKVRLSQRRTTAVLGALFTLAEALQFYFQHRGH